MRLRPAHAAGRLCTPACTKAASSAPYPLSKGDTSAQPLRDVMEATPMFTVRQGRVQPGCQPSQRLRRSCRPARQRRAAGGRADLRTARTDGPTLRARHAAAASAAQTGPCMASRRLPGQRRQPGRRSRVLTCQVGGRVLLHVRQVWHLRSDKLMELGSRSAALVSQASDQPRHCLSLLEIAMLLKQTLFRRAVLPGTHCGKLCRVSVGRRSSPPKARGD
jgi:hypothetical protein